MRELLTSATHDRRRSSIRRRPPPPPGDLSARFAAVSQALWVEQLSGDLSLTR